MEQVSDTTAPGCLMRWTLSIVGLCCTLGLAEAARADPNYCDAGLRVSQQDQRSYRMRGDRCEGLYEGQRSADVLALVSFGDIAASWPARQKLTLRWDGAQPTTLRVVSLRRNTFYRMDTRGQQGSFNWDLSFARAISISGGDVGYLAWYLAGQAPAHLVYLPTTTAASGKASKPVLVFVPAAPLSKVYTSVFEVDASMAPAQRVAAKLEAAGYMPADMPMRVRLPDGLTHGKVYAVEVAADVRNAGSTATHLLIRP